MDPFEKYDMAFNRRGVGPRFTPQPRRVSTPGKTTAGFWALIYPTVMGVSTSRSLTISASSGSPEGASTPTAARPSTPPGQPRLPLFGYEKPATRESWVVASPARTNVHRRLRVVVVASSRPASAKNRSPFCFFYQMRDVRLWARKRTSSDVGLDVRFQGAKADYSARSE